MNLSPVAKALRQRLRGERPSFFQTLSAALTVGIGAAALTYKLLRGKSDK